MPNDLETQGGRAVYVAFPDEQEEKLYETVTTDILTEGTENLFFTEERINDALRAVDGITDDLKVDAPTAEELLNEDTDLNVNSISYSGMGANGAIQFNDEGTLKGAGELTLSGEWFDIYSQTYVEGTFSKEQIDSSDVRGFSTYVYPDSGFDAKTSNDLVAFDLYTQTYDDSYSYQDWSNVRVYSANMFLDLEQRKVDWAAGINNHVFSYNAEASQHASGMETFVYGDTLETPTVYGLRTNVSTGADVDTVYGSHIDVSGATDAGETYGLYQEGDSATNYFAGNVGIGTDTPSTALDVSGAVNATELRVNGDPVSTVATTGEYSDLNGLPDLSQYLTEAPVTSVNGQTGAVKDQPRVFQVSAPAQNIGGKTDIINWEPEPVRNDEGAFQIGEFDQALVCQKAGSYDIRATMAQHSTDTRTNVSIRFLLNGERVKPYGASGYIRDNSNHNDSSVHVERYFDLEVGDRIDVEYFPQGSEGGRVELVPEGTLLEARRVA